MITIIFGSCEILETKLPGYLEVGIITHLLGSLEVFISIISDSVSKNVIFVQIGA